MCPRIKSLIQAVLGISALVALTGVNSCTWAPHAIVGSKESYTSEAESGECFGRRSPGAETVVQDPNTSFSLPVWSLGEMTEYAFAVGSLESTDCTNESIYSDWISKDTLLTFDIANLPNGMVRLCAIGRGTVKGAPYTQPLHQAGIYEWEKTAVQRTTVLVDHVSNPVNWNGMQVFETGYSSIRKGAAGSTFTGNGQKIDKVGVVFAMADGSAIPNGATPEHIDWYLTFHSSLTSFASNPYSIDGSLPETKWFDVPSNPDFLNVIGAAGPYHLRYAEFDVSDKNWVTSPGEVQGLTILPEAGTQSFDVGFRTYFSLSNGGDAIGNGSDWYKADFPSYVAGPDTLSNLGFPHGKAAYFISTQP